MNCPHCGSELTPREIGRLYGTLGRTETVKKMAKAADANGKPAGVLTPRKVDQIRRSDKSIHELARKYKVKYLTIWRVKNNKTWVTTTDCPRCGHKLTRREIVTLFGTLGGSTTTEKKSRSSVTSGRTRALLTMKDAEEIRKSEQPTMELAKHYQVSYDTIWLIRKNKTYKPLDT